MFGMLACSGGCEPASVPKLPGLAARENAVTGIVLGVLNPPAAAVVWLLVIQLLAPIVTTMLPRRVLFNVAWIVIAFGGLIGALAGREGNLAEGSAVSLAVALAVWWYHRPGSKRTGGLIGAKLRALRDALVRKMREAARPRPVLRPLPGGARVV